MRVLALLTVVTLLPVGDAHAQVPRGTQKVGGSPDLRATPVRVGSLKLEGVNALSTSVLRDSLVTRSSGCRGLLLRPICSVTHLSIFFEKNELDRAEIPRDELRIRVIYFRNGYRQARVASSVIPADKDPAEYVDVTFTVDEGPLTTVGLLEVTQTLDVLSARRVRSAGLPAEGGALDLNRLDSARIRLRNALWDQGYADGVVRDSIVVDPVTHLAQLRVAIEPGRVATIGEVEVEGNSIVSDRTVTRVLDLPTGQPFRRTDLTAAQRRLLETELFRQSVVRVPPTTDSVKRLVVSVREAPPRSVKVGAGFNTTDFGQSEARFIRYNWLGGARRLDARVAVGNLLARQLNGRGVFPRATRRAQLRRILHQPRAQRGHPGGGVPDAGAVRRGAGTTGRRGGAGSARGVLHAARVLLGDHVGAALPPHDTHARGEHRAADARVRVRDPVVSTILRRAYRSCSGFPAAQLLATPTATVSAEPTSVNHNGSITLVMKPNCCAAQRVAMVTIATLMPRIASR